MTVDPTIVIERLESGIPLFTDLPQPGQVKSPRIIGLESELSEWDPGMGRDHGATGHSPYIGHNQYKWFPCGGQVYRDQPKQVLEICTPETSNPVEAAVRMEMLRRKVAAEYSASEGAGGISLYDTSTDWGMSSTNSLGNHESYSGSVSKISGASALGPLAPYLVARIIFTGTGYVDGNGMFEISPRARFMKAFMSEETTTPERPLINTREFRNRADDEKNWRLHFICGESNRNQIASLLKVGFMSLAIDMLEEGCLPRFPFEERTIADDMEHVSKHSSGWIQNGIKNASDKWHMPSIIGGRYSALDLMNVWQEKASEVFSGRDEITDTILVLMRYVLDKLDDPEKNLGALSRVLDWSAKLGMSLLSKQEGDGYSTPHALDMEYHLLGSESLSTYLQSHHLASVLVPEKVISGSAGFPPQDTRACFRGWLVTRLAREKSHYFDGSGSLHLIWNDCLVRRDGRDNACHFRIEDPFQTYHEHRESVENFLTSKYIT